MEKAEQLVEDFAAGAARAMIFMRTLSAVALLKWPEDSGPAPAPLHHVRSMHSLLVSLSRTSALIMPWVVILLSCCELSPLSLCNRVDTIGVLLNSSAGVS